MNLSDISTVKKILSENGFSFKKSLGQNFLIDGSVCPAMAQSAADDQTGVLEIGPGIGVLTVECARAAKRVVAVELDERLRPVLAKTLAGFDNTEVVFGDALKMDLNKLIAEKFSDCKQVAVCANLPYYITSPLIIKLLESRLNIDSLTVMVQKEAAERICATVGSREAGALSVYVSYFANPEILFGVERESFMPAPNVDSAVIRLNIRKEPPINVKNEEGFFSFVKACFAQRRKTLLNSLSNTMKVEKERIREVLNSLNIDEAVRSEALNMEQLGEIYNNIF